MQRIMEAGIMKHAAATGGVVIESTLFFLALLIMISSGLSLLCLLDLIMLCKVYSKQIANGCELVGGTDTLEVKSSL